MELVPRLVDAARVAFPSASFIGAILPTQWIAAPQHVDGLLAEHTPDIVIHFGVSRRARGFEIERRGHNHRAPTLDAVGHAPTIRAVHAGGPLRRPSRLPVAEIVDRLRRRGVPAFQSWSAGTYLCNAILYHGLAATETTTASVGFVHIPASLAPPLRGTAPGLGAQPHARCPLTWAQALDGALEIVATCLDQPSLSRDHGATITARVG